jgi:uncharacterized protein (TIGR02145 family)
MKQFYLLVTLVLLASVNLLQAQNDNMYFWKAGQPIKYQSLKPADLDSITFKTPQNVVFDIDGNGYETVIICSQIWTASNLNVSKYRNGDVIPQVTDPNAWGLLTTGAWCYYNDETVNEAVYGKLYNWYAVNDPRGLAPEGYHIPTDAEWTTLTTCLGGNTVAGGAMKETGTTHWQSPNTGAANSSGFTGLPGGYHDRFGSFYNVGGVGYWWSSTEFDTTYAWYWYLSYDYGGVTRTGANKPDGFSVRCLRD